MSNPVRQVPVSEVPIPDRRLPGIDMERYVSNFRETNSFLGFDGERATNAHTKKGCPRRCSFCGRTDKVLRARTPQQAFDEYRYLAEEFGIDYVFDHSDTWALGVGWLEELARIINDRGHMPVRLSVFADLRDLSTKAINLMKTVGVDTVEVGIESGDEGVLRENRKFIQRDRIVERAMAVTDAGIKVEASYVLGILGETRESVLETVDLSRELGDRTQRVRSYFNLVIPLPGTPIWQCLMRDEDMNRMYGHDYVFDIEQLRRDYVQRHCSLGEDGYESLFEQRDMILAENELAVMEYALDFKL